MSVDGIELARSEMEARILVLDDEADVAMLLADSLRDADPSWDVVMETDPKEALERLGAESFDCVVTDLIMPAMDGLEFAQQARGCNEEVALIAVSGRGTLEASIRALRMGFADYIEKPFDTDEIQRSVCRTLRRHQRETAVEQRFAELAQSNAKLEAQRAQLAQKLEIAGHDLVLSNKRMARQLDDLARTADAARALMGIVELEDLLGLCAEFIADAVECATSSLALYEGHDAAVGLLVRAYAESDDPPVLCWLRSPIHSGVMCRAAQTGKSIHITSVGESMLIAPPEKELWSTGRLLVVPVPYQDMTVGVAVLHRGADAPDFEAADIKRLSGLAQVMGPAILSAKVHHRQRCQVYATMETLADRVERREPCRLGHSARVQAYAQPLGEALRLAQSEMGALQIASRLHDVGYLGMPASTIDHPGPLTDEQWDLVRRHPETGEEILRPLDFFGEVGTIIRSHHESYDGTGYPEHKAGDEIPKVSRVIAVADAFDAMTSDRPYRQAMSVEAALERIGSLAGQQFDPQVAEALLGQSPSLLESIRGMSR